MLSMSRFGLTDGKEVDQNRHTMEPGPRDGKWYAAVYSHDKSEQLSEIAEFYTDSAPCEPWSGGCQWAEVDFVGNW